MKPSRDQQTAEEIHNRRLALAQEAMRHYLDRHPELHQRFPEQGVARCLEDTEFHLSYLEQAIAFSTPALFTGYIQWAASMLQARQIPAADLAENLAAMRVAAVAQLPAESAHLAAEYIDHAAARLGQSAPPPSFLDGTDPMAQLARDYAARLLDGDRRSAGALISAAVQGGAPIADIYLRVFQPALYEIGRLWQCNVISVAQEHYCSAATQVIMSQLYTRMFNAQRRNQTLVAASVAGDLHEIGLRTLADYFEMAGWDTYYLGASVPISDLPRFLKDRHCDVLALSATTAPRLGAIRKAIETVRAAPQCRTVTILVGGLAFSGAPDLWRKAGADGYASDAAAALQIAEQLVRQRQSRET